MRALGSIPAPHTHTQSRAHTHTHNRTTVQNGLKEETEEEESRQGRRSSGGPGGVVVGRAPWRRAKYYTGWVGGEMTWPRKVHRKCSVD